MNTYATTAHVQTTTLRLYGAVLAAVKSHFDNNAPFSAYDITQFVRAKLDDNEWELFNGGDASTVHHGTVKGYVEEMFDNDLFFGETVVNHGSTSGASYKVYTPVPTSTCQQADDDDDIVAPKLAQQDTISIVVNNVSIEKLGNKVNITTPTGRVFSL